LLKSFLYGVSIPKTSYFYNKYAIMKWMKLTACTVFLFSFIVISCELDDITEDGFFVGNALPMNGAQETPPVTTAATGTIDATYSIYTKVLTYTVNWSGLSGLPVAAHVHGLATQGYAAGIVQPMWTAANAVLYPASGKYTGSLFVDGVNIREENILAGAYYINLHTAAKPNGEIRGQIILTRK
jgi:hypothetical protein